MAIEALVRPGDELSVEAPLAAAGLVSCRQEDGLPVGIKGEGNPPDATASVAAQFLHIRVPGASEGVGMRPAELRALPLEQGSPCETRIPNVVRERIKLGVEGVKELNDPRSCIQAI